MALPLPYGCGIRESVRAQVGSAVAGCLGSLGKFDAGHRTVMEQAARLGTSYTYSCAGVPEFPIWERSSKHCQSFFRKARALTGLEQTSEASSSLRERLMHVGNSKEEKESQLQYLEYAQWEESKLVKEEMVPTTVAGGIVALGKFDALHIGHRALAQQAAKMGTPYLVSFSGIAEILGWEKRLPIVAPSDRGRVMSLWSTHCGGASVREFPLEFGLVRSLSPQEFLQKLATELKVKGVVAGADYRFGYKAAGNSSDLVRICSELGLQASVVDSVMDQSEGSACEISNKSREKGQVSSTRVRRALADGNMRSVAELLGRMHRVVLNLENLVVVKNGLQIPLASAQNQYPREGTYACTVIKESEVIVNGGSSRRALSRQGQLTVGDNFFSIRLLDGNFEEFALSQSNAISLEIAPGDAVI